MRYECNDPAFAGDFVEFSDSWSRKEVRETWNTVPTSAEDIQDGDDDGPLLACLRPKIIALRLTCSGAPPITDPNDLTVERADDMDTRLYSWFAGVWMRHLRELRSLGNALRQGLFVTSAGSNSNGHQKTATKRKATPARRNQKS